MATDKRRGGQRHSRGTGARRGGEQQRSTEGGARRSEHGSQKSNRGSQRPGRGNHQPSRHHAQREGHQPHRPEQGSGADPREIALEVLGKVRRDGAFANLVLPPMLDEARLSRRDAGFATALTYGTLRLQGRYDAIIARCSNRAPESLDPVVLDVLRLGAHQILSMRVPSHAAVSTSVTLVTRHAGRGPSGLVNAVLRRISERDTDEWIQLLLDDAATPIQGLADAHSHPQWITSALRQTLLGHGRDESELAAFLESDNADPAVILCARPGLISADELAEQALAASHEEATRGHLSPYALALAGGDPARLPAVRSGAAGVEDEGSQLVALMLAEAPLEGTDERWLDMCAGPGGKSALLGAIAAQRGAHLLANEVTPHRVDLVCSSTRAIPEGVVEVANEDGRIYGEAMPGAFDRILVDAPCTGLGSLRRRPEARWRREPGDVKDLSALQRELLASAFQALRVGGVLAYVTCSPHLQETTFVVKDARRAFERAGGGLELLHAGKIASTIASGIASPTGSSTPESPDGVNNSATASSANPAPATGPSAGSSSLRPTGAGEEMLQLWPHLDNTDAMFIALLRRTA